MDHNLLCVGAYLNGSMDGEVEWWAIRYYIRSQMDKDSEGSGVGALEVAFA